MGETIPVLRYVNLPRDERPDQGVSPEERAILDKVNQKVAAAESLEQVVDFVFETTRPLCPCDRIGLAFVEEDGRRVTAHYAVADYEPILLRKPYSEDLNGSSLKEVIERGALRIINNLETYLKEHPKSVSTKLILKEGVRSSMTCPLSVDGRNVGLLFRSSRQPNAYDDHDVLMHQAIAERLSQAVEKARRIEQLQNALNDYFEMLGFVSHELKSPVASMVTNARVLLDGYVGELTEKQRARIEPMVRKGEYLLGLVREYLDLARMEGGNLEPKFTTVDDFVNDVVEPSIEIVLPQIEEKKMRLTRNLPDGPIRVECDPNLLKIVVVNLIGNAAKYGNDGGEIRVAVERNDMELNVAVWNEGPGFPPSARAKLFRKFSRIETPELMKRKGTGVGLYTSWRIIQLHGGRMAAESEEGSWAEFSFRIPQPITLKGAVSEGVDR
ncbi:MAG: GAF domain-containing sensor histidine kinase [Planctomycetota bacterium]